MKFRTLHSGVFHLVLEQTRSDIKLKKRFSAGENMAKKAGGQAGSPKKQHYAQKAQTHDADDDQLERRKIKKAWILLISGICFIALIAIVVSLANGSSSRNNDDSGADANPAQEENKVTFEMSNDIILTSLEDYREMLNRDVIGGLALYADYVIPEFQRVNPDDDSFYNLYEAKITDTLKMYIVANYINHSIYQVRWEIDPNSDNAAKETTLAICMLEQTMKYEHGDEADSSKVLSALDISSRSFGGNKNKTYEFKDDIYRVVVSENSATLYFTDMEFDFIEEKQIAITKNTTYKDIENAEAAKQEEQKEAARAAKTRTFSAGNYKVGRDIDSGTYNVTAVSGSGNFFVDNTYGRSIINEIMSPSGGDYLTSYKNASLESGYEIEIKGNLVLKFEAVD